METNLGREHTDEFPRILSSHVTGLAQEPNFICCEMLFCCRAAYVMCGTAAVPWSGKDRSSKG